jgi:hypothetical protein
LCMLAFWQQVRMFPMKFIKIKHIIVSSCHYMIECDARGRKLVCRGKVWMCVEREILSGILFV